MEDSSSADDEDPPEMDDDDDDQLRLDVATPPPDANSDAVAATDPERSGQTTQLCTERRQRRSTTHGS